MKNLVDKNPRAPSYNNETPLDLATMNKGSWVDDASRKRKLEVCRLFHENGIYISGHFPNPPSPFADVI